MREEPLGEDRRGRRYWFFFNDAARLWVEAPKGEVVERDNGSTWAWAFYDTAAHVDMLMDSLDGRGQAGYTCHGYACHGYTCHGYACHGYTHCDARRA